MASCTWACCLSYLFCCCTVIFPAFGQTSSSIPEAENEQASLRAARTAADPAARRDGLRQFLHNYPESALSVRAESLLLDTYLASFPDQTAAIHELASKLISSTPAGFERWLQESEVANEMAAADDHGADMQDASKWATEALTALSETSYRQEISRAQIRYKLPRLSSTAAHREYIGHRAAFLASLAHVELRSGDLANAEIHLTDAYGLQPLSAEVNKLRGDLALAQHRDKDALEALEAAEALGGLDQPGRAQLLQLYVASEHGNAAGLEAEIDRRYETMFPALFTLPKHALPAGGHTVLLELFTGSGCLPCVAPDLAVESLLNTYSPADLVILEYDQHIPRPDPLTNPDGVARAASYQVQTTPEAFLDGASLQILGSARTDVENVVVGFADQIEQRAAEPSPLQILLTGSRSAGDAVQARVTVNLRPVERSGSAAISFRTLTRATLHVALVQDHIRYSGENGVRLHRMVVRATQEAPLGAYLGSSASPYTTTFRTDDLDLALHKYLDDYERSNDQFGPFKFLTKEIPIHNGALGLVAWVQDGSTRQVLQAAYVPIP